MCLKMFGSFLVQFSLLKVTVSVTSDFRFRIHLRISFTLVCLSAVEVSSKAKSSTVDFSDSMKSKKKSTQKSNYAVVFIFSMSSHAFTSFNFPYFT